MKKGDALFNEQFIILHDDDDNREIILKKSEIVVIASCSEDEITDYTIVGMANGKHCTISESVDEILELL